MAVFGPGEHTGRCAATERTTNLARPIPTFLAQQLWWLFGIDPVRMGFQRKGLWTRRAIRAHLRLEREFHVGVVTDGVSRPNIVGLHVFWLNRHCRRTRFSIDPDPASADALWIYAQDPLGDASRALIADKIGRAPSGVTVFNRLEAYDFYHRTDCFELLAQSGVPVPRSAFMESDIGMSVLWKPVGSHSTALEPQPYRAPRPGFRPFEFIDVRDEKGLYRRYRAIYLFGRIYQASAFTAREPVVRYANAVEIDRQWLMTEEEAQHVATIAEVSGLDFFAVDYLRRKEDGRPVFTDVNSFPVLKDIPSESDRYGYWHDFDNVRPHRRGAEKPMTPWQWIDETIVESVSRRRRGHSAAAAQSGPST
jgi:hypothetical protein